MLTPVRACAIGVIAGFVACVPDPHNHVLFYNDGIAPPLNVANPPAQHAYLTGFATAPATSSQWSVGLSNRICTDDLEIRYQRDQAISEAHLFLRDPQAVFNEVSAYHGYDVISTASFPAYGERRTQIPAGLPNAVVVSIRRSLHSISQNQKSPSFPTFTGSLGRPALIPITLAPTWRARINYIKGRTQCLGKESKVLSPDCAPISADCVRRQPPLEARTVF